SGKGGCYSLFYPKTRFLPLDYSVHRNLLDRTVNNNRLYRYKGSSLPMCHSSKHGRSSCRASLQDSNLQVGAKHLHESLVTIVGVVAQPLDLIVQSIPRSATRRNQRVESGVYNDVWSRGRNCNRSLRVGVES